MVATITKNQEISKIPRLQSQEGCCQGWSCGFSCMQYTFARARTWSKAAALGQARTRRYGILYTLGPVK